MISLEWEEDKANKNTGRSKERSKNTIAIAYPPFLPNVLQRTSTLWVVGGGTENSKHWNTKRILSPVSPPGEKRKNLPLFWEALSHLSNG